MSLLGLYHLATLLQSGAFGAIFGSVVPNSRLSCSSENVPWVNGSSSQSLSDDFASSGIILNSF